MRTYETRTLGAHMGIETIKAVRLGAALGKLFPKRYPGEESDRDLRIGEEITIKIRRMS